MYHIISRESAAPRRDMYLKKEEERMYKPILVMGERGSEEGHVPEEEGESHLCISLQHRTHSTQPHRTHNTAHCTPHTAHHTHTAHTHSAQMQNSTQK